MEHKYPNLKFYYIFDSSFTKFLKLEGIVLWPFVFISKPKDKTSPRILKHELTHVDQVRREGPLKFYTKYLYYIYKSRQQNGDFQNAFFYNEYEDEAYENENHPLTDEEIRETEWLSEATASEATASEATASEASKRESKKRDQSRK
jgi:hypothetical protein